VIRCSCQIILFLKSPFFKGMTLEILKLTGFVEVGEKSSHYGLNMLGYTCATKAKTVGRDEEIRSKAQKIVSVRIVDWNSFT